LWGGDVELVTCSDGRLTWPLERIRKLMVDNGQRVRIRRVLGAAFNEDTVKAIVDGGSLKENRTIVILSHDGCAMAKMMAEEIGRSGEGLGQSYKLIFRSLEEQACKTPTEIEHALPLIGAGRLHQVCEHEHLGKKMIIPESVSTPHITPAEHKVLIVTSVMTESYEALGLDPRDKSLYYQQNDLAAVMTEVLLSCDELKIKSIRLISQSVEEDDSIRRVYVAMNANAKLGELRVRIEEPMYAKSRVGQQFASRAQQLSASASPSASTSPSKKDRASI